MNSNEIILDFSQVPSDVGLLVAENEHAYPFAESVVQSLGSVDEGERQILYAELVGEIGALVDRHTGNVRASD